jgi:phosphatidylserine/phosphatidylglycerophosphate/cardiolipin synthase-like enzyme
MAKSPSGLVVTSGWNEPLIGAGICRGCFYSGFVPVGRGNQLTGRCVFFAKGGCTEAVVEELGKARETVLVQAYLFTSAPVAKALVEAHQRGVRVEVLLDKSQRTERYSSATFLIHAGIATLIDARHAIAHNKVMVIDGQTVLTGSFNFTKAAEEKNAENLLVLRGKELASK